MNPYVDILNCRRRPWTSSRAAIKQAYLDMYETTPAHNISVKKLCENAHVARTTFYANFHHTDEVLQEIEDELVAEILDINLPTLKDESLKLDVKNSWKITSAFLQDHEKTLHRIMVDQPDLRFIEKWKDAIKYYYWDAIYKEGKFHESIVVLELISAMALADYVLWLKEPFAQNYDEVEKAIRFFLSFDNMMESSE